MLSISHLGVSDNAPSRARPKMLSQLHLGKLPVPRNSAASVMALTPLILAHYFLIPEWIMIRIPQNILFKHHFANRRGLQPRLYSEFKFGAQNPKNLQFQEFVLN